MDRIQELAGQYLLNSELYRAGLSRITDQEFNQLEQELKSLAPNHPVFKKVDEGCVLKGIGTGSFDSWYNRLPENESLMIQPKIDGIAMMLRYVDGALVAAFNRVGRDKTYHMRFIHNIPQFIAMEGTVHVRGELYAPCQTPSTSQRLAAGHIRKKSPESSSDDIRFCAFEMVNLCSFETEQMMELSSLGFEIPSFSVADKKKENRDYIKECHELWLDSRLFGDYPTDGIVIKTNNKSLQKLYDFNSKTQQGLIAIKNYWTED